MDKGFTLFDISIVLFVLVLGFITFFYINDYKQEEYENVLKYLIVTENAITKYNDNGIGFAEKDSFGLKTTFQNTIENPKAISPIDRIELYVENNLVFEDGNISCEKQIKISRLVIYENEISKAIFTFCE
jgi:hypothetical protein